MLTKFRNSRALQCGALLLAGMLLAGAAHIPILREIASFLIVEDSLRPSAAIVPLGGQTPFREMEAAKLYRAGWAPAVVIVPGVPSKESEALQELGIKRAEEWELRRDILIQQGVPPTAIIVPQGKAGGTLEELQAVYAALRSKEAPVILVTSKYHTRRTGLTWHYVTAGRSHGIIHRSSSFNTGRIDHIYQDPHEPHPRLKLVYGDLNDGSSLNRILRGMQPDEIYNLGAQSHVMVSFDVTEYTGEITGMGTVRLLEAIRSAV